MRLRWCPTPAHSLLVLSKCFIPPTGFSLVFFLWAFVTPCCRWCVTGTPIGNGMNDLYGLLAFMDHDPFSEQAVWTKYISKPFENKNPVGLMRIRLFLKQV